MFLLSAEAWLWVGICALLVACVGVVSYILFRPANRSEQEETKAGEAPADEAAPPADEAPAEETQAGEEKRDEEPAAEE